MTKEELEKEADKYADDYATPDLDSSFRVYMFEASKEGYLAGAEPREKRIAELEKENANLKIDMDSSCKAWKKLSDEYKKRWKECEKKNAELKSIKDVADLIRLNNSHIVAMAQLNNNNVALRKENAELKHTTSTLRQEKDNSNAHAKAMEIVAKTRTDQLTKAKDIIEDYMIIVKGGNITVCSVPEENRCINVSKLNEQAEQFLKGDGCPDCFCEDCTKEDCGIKKLGLIEVKK